MPVTQHAPDTPIAALRPCRSHALGVTVVFVLAAPLAAVAAGDVKLRLDRTLSEAAPGPADKATRTLLRFGSAEIRQDIVFTRERIEQLQARNEQLDEAVRERRELLAGLRELSGQQDRAIDGSREVIAADAAAARASAPVAPPPLRSGSAAASDDGAAPALPHWAMAAGLGIVLLILLAAGALLLRARRGKSGAGPVSLGESIEAPRRADALPAVNAQDAAPAVLVMNAGAGTGTLSDDTLDLDADAAESGGEQASSPASALADERPPPDSEDRWTRTLVSRKAADPQALKEVDTLIAFEQYEKAKAVLDEMLVADPENPELLLRHYHVRTQGGIETTDDDEALLKAMMDGPLSDTMLRVRELGRGLMPGDPLFQDKAQWAAASHVIKASRQAASDGDSGDPALELEPPPKADDKVVPFSATVKLARSPLAGNEAP